MGAKDTVDPFLSSRVQRMRGWSFGTGWYVWCHELGLLVRKAGRTAGNWQGSDDGWRLVLVFQRRERRPLRVTQHYFPRTRMSRSVVFSSTVLVKVVAVFISVLFL